VIWTVTFNDVSGAALVRTRGLFNTTDHRRMVADIVSRHEWHPGHPILFDHRELLFGDARYQDMLVARNNHLEHELRIGNARSAILMGSDADYGLGRQFEMLASGEVSAELKIFTDEASARDWLCEPKRMEQA
jgi:hypothetical protein